MMTPGLVLLFSAAPVSAQHGIADLAPEGSFFIVGIDNLEETVNRIRAGRIGEMWNSPEVQAQLGEHVEQMNFQLTMLEEQLQLEPGTLGYPRGAVGMAAFTAMDPEQGLDTLGVIALVDFKESEGTVEAILNMAAEQLEAEGADFERVEIGGASFLAIAHDPAAMAEDMEQVEGMEGMPFGDPMAMIEPFLLGMETMYIGQQGSTMLVGTNPDVLSEAVAVINGEDATASVSDRQEYQDALEQVGGGDAHVVVMVDKLSNVAAIHPLLGMGIAQSLEPLKALGVGNIRSLSTAVDFDETGAIAVQRMGLLVNGEKTGVLALLDHESPLSGVPAFVSAESKGYSRINFDFGGMMGVVDSVVASIPGMAAQAQEAIAPYRPDLEALFSSLGSQVHIAQSGTAPLFAIALTNAEQFEGLAATWAPQLGLEPRDFVGHTIYSGDFAPVAIGIGGGHAFIGDAQAVEQALRSVGEGGAAALADDEEFQHAMDALDEAGVVGWGYSSAGSMLDVLSDPAMFGGAFGGEVAPPPIDPEIIAVLKEHIGPSVWQLRSTDNGFVMTSWTLEPIEE
jgi:hypothetical protein